MKRGVPLLLARALLAVLFDDHAEASPEVIALLSASGNQYILLITTHDFALVLGEFDVRGARAS